MIRAHILVKGHVHGVGFRANTRRKAAQLGVRGWVRNLRDGRVEAVVEGSEVAVNQIIEWFYHGPSTAHVTEVRVEKTEPTGEFNRFAVISGTY